MSKYEDYIASPEWRSLRQKILERDCHQCRTCCSTEVLEVHHRTYDRLGHEDSDDLITLCHDCHEAITAVIRRRRYQKIKIVLANTQRLTPITYRDSNHAEIEVSTHIRITPVATQWTASRSLEPFFKGDQENQQQAREDGRRF